MVLVVLLFVLSILSAARSPRGKPLTLLEAADYLNVSERWMRRAVSERAIPFHRHGRLLRFHLEDLEAYSEARRVDAAS